jgi:hypothetical protein
MAGTLRFYERAEVKDAIAYLRLLSNPADDEAFARIINVPRRNLGDAALNSVRIVAAETGTALLAAARAAAGTLGIARAASLVAFLDLLDDLCAYAQEHPGVARLLGRLYDRTALVPEETSDERANSRRENLLQLLSVAASYDAKHPDGGTLSEFLEAMALAGDTDGEEDERDQVTLMTLHASKGLEYPVVILTGMEEKLCPHDLALRGAEAIEEERRLCYVGITRAQTELHITHARKRVLYGKVTTPQPSRFLDEIAQAASKQPAQGRPGDDLASEIPRAPHRRRGDPHPPLPHPGRRARVHAGGRRSRGASKPGVRHHHGCRRPSRDRVVRSRAPQAVRHARAPGAATARQLTGAATAVGVKPRVAERPRHVQAARAESHPLKRRPCGSARAVSGLTSRRQSGRCSVSVAGS